MNKNVLVFTLVGFVAGLITVLAISSLAPVKTESSSSTKSSDKKPLYWVAPMDSSYRRDKPGKSPMGMDLVPVYEEENNAGSPGTVKIQPDIINNLSVKTGEVKREPLLNRLQTVGYVTYDETTLAHIHSRTDGWIEKLYVNHNGQYIKAGQPLYTIYSPVLVNAQQEYLLAKKRNNSSLFSSAKARLKSLNFNANEFKKIDQTGKPLYNVTFYADSDGVIDNLNIREGLFIKPGTRIMSIGDLDTIWVEVELFERQLPFVSVGQQAKLTLGYLPTKTWTGMVDYIYPILNPKNRTAKIRLEFENPDHQLKPNMFADVSLHSETNMNVLQVPREAVIRTENSDRVVLALGNGQFKSVNVTLGRVASEAVEIVDGLVEGDKVVVSGQFLIDSESSIESDFKRFTQEQRQSIPSATVSGVINSIDISTQTLNISRDAIPKWNRGPMTMDFLLGDSLDISTFNEGDVIEFTFEIRDSGFVITEVNHEVVDHQHD